MTEYHNALIDAKSVEDAANAKLSSFVLFFKKDRNIASADLFRKAASLYGINKKYNDYLRCMTTAAKIYEENQNPLNASICYLDSARIAKMIDISNTMQYYVKYMHLTNKTKHADIYKEIGEFLKSIGKYDDAIEFLTKAINEFETTNRSYSIYACLDNLCRIYMNTQKYKEAGDILLKMANKVKLSNQNLIFTAILCFISYDPVYAKEILKSYTNQLSHIDWVFLDMCIMSIVTKNYRQLANIINHFKFKTKVKDEYSDIVKWLKSKVSDNILTNDSNDEIDMT